MILAAAHPCYFPDIAFFQKMRRADLFVLADSLRYSTSSHLNRARIKTAQGGQWLSVPIETRGRSGQRVNEVEIDSLRHWQRNHRRSIFVNYIASPYFARYEDALSGLFTRPWRYLAALATETIHLITHEMAIHTVIRFLSEFTTRTDRTARVMDLLWAAACDTYLVTPRERSLIDEKVLHSHGAQLLVLQCAHPFYHQQFGNFIQGLSTLDLIMNEGCGARQFLDMTSAVQAVQ